MLERKIESCVFIKISWSKITKEKCYDLALFKFTPACKK